MRDTQTASTTRPPRHWIIIILLLGLGSTILLTGAAGASQTLFLLRNANLFFVACIVLFQSLRYVAMTLSTRVVAEIVNMRVSFFRLFEATVAAQAANRTFVGGAAGLVVRGAFFIKQGMHAGTFAAVEGIEDVVSLCAISLMFLSGIAIVFASGATSGFRWDVIAYTVVGALVIAGAVIWFIRRPVLVERGLGAIVRGVNRILGKLLRRNLYDAARIHRAVEDFYRALALAQRDPMRVFISFGCALARLGCDWIALYFAFRAVGYDVPPGNVLLIFVVSTSVATLAAVPGQIGVMETVLTVMSTALGIPAPVAVSATLLYRLISFWLPIPFGYAFAWNLERNELL